MTEDSGLLLFGGEPSLPIIDVPHHVPMRNGRRLHKSIGRRWAIDGIKVRGGRIRMESWMQGGTRVTTLGAVNRFIAAVSAARSGDLDAACHRTPKERDDQSRRAADAIDRRRSARSSDVR
jgi:hypothetical protein